MTTVPDPRALAVAVHEVRKFVRLPPRSRIVVSVHPESWRALAKMRIEPPSPIQIGATGMLFMGNPVVVDPEVPEGSWRILIEGEFKMMEVPS